VSEVFRNKVEHCLSEIAHRLATCLDGAERRGELLVHCYEGAALRTRLRRDSASLGHLRELAEDPRDVVDVRRAQLLALTARAPAHLLPEAAGASMSCAGRWSRHRHASE